MDSVAAGVEEEEGLSVQPVAPELVDDTGEEESDVLPTRR